MWGAARPAAMTKEESKIARKQSQAEGKYTAKATVFSDLFHIPKYCFQLFQSLHPEEKDVTPADIASLTLTNVLLNTLYNDLGLLVGNRLLILVEAQATWTKNILIRLLLYLAETYNRLIVEREWDVYGSKALPLPEPEFYVIYTGERKRRPKTLSFSEAFFGGRKTALDFTVTFIYGGEDGDIIGQYVTFCHVLNDQYRKLGRTAEAVREAIRICKDRNVLKEYLEEREGEVINIMLTLFDQEVAERLHVASVAREADRKARADENLIRIRGLMETLKLSPMDAMNAMKIPPDQQAIYIKKLR